MSNKCLFVVLSLSLFFVGLQAQVSVREGLPNFIYQAKSGGDLCVAYFGGSITAQPGWRVQSLSYLRDTYPAATLRELNATIGGTGSDLGVLRMDYDVLRDEPNLLFVEFAVNDSRTDPELIRNSMEGIVRKTWRRYPFCDICFVYTFHEPLLPELLAGEMNESVRIMETVASHYGIPSIHLGSEALTLLKQGKMLIKPADGIQTKVSGDALDLSFEPKVEADGKIYFSPDGVHPYLNTGHVLYTRALIDGLRQCDGVAMTPGRHKLGKPLSVSNYENSISVCLDTISPGDGWEETGKGDGLYDAFSSRFKSLWKGREEAEISFRFQGTTLIAYDLIGPGSCHLEVTVDGVRRDVNRFDGYCTYWRIASVVLAEGLDPRKIHQATIRVSPLGDKKEILFEQNRTDLIHNSAKYKLNEWYIGQLFLLGQDASIIK